MTRSLATAPRRRFEFIEPDQHRAHVREGPSVLLITRHIHPTHVASLVQRRVERPPLPRYRRASARVEPPPGSAGSPRVRATTRSPNAASSAANFRSAVSRLMGREDTRGNRRAVTMTLMQISFLGGATTVTGSQYLLETSRARILIDCGMFQGSPNESVRNRLPFGFDPKTIDAMLLTHAHLDHCGLIPVLVRDGFRGPIHATAGTVELAGLVLLDSGKLHEEFAKREARWEKRHPDKVEADDRKEADQYAAALELAAQGESIGTVAAAMASGSAEAADATDPVAPTGQSPRSKPPRPPSTSRRPSSPSATPRHPPPGRTTPRRSCVASRPTSISISTSRCTRPRTPRPRWPRSRPPTTAASSTSRPGISATFLDAGHILGSAIIRLRVARQGRRSGADHRLLRRPRPARDADPARPDAEDRRRLRPHRIDLRRSRARARGRGDPHPGRDDPDGRGREGRAARPVVRDRSHPGGRLGARSPDRARRDPAAPAVPRLADGLEGLGHLPPSPGLLRRGDRALLRSGATPLDYPNQTVTNDVKSSQAIERARGRT